MDSKVGGAQSQTSISYDEFEPLCTWQREDTQDILVIHLLPDFKKEQLRIQISNSGILKITGENVVEGKKRSRFLKEVRVSKDYDSSNIHAKFSQGRLRITLPKNVLKPSIVPDSTTVTPSPQGDQIDNSRLPSYYFTQVMVNVGFVVVVAFSVYSAYKYWTSYVRVDED